MLRSICQKRVLLTSLSRVRTCSLVLKKHLNDGPGDFSRLTFSVTSIDPDTGILTSSHPSHFPLRDDTPWREPAEEEEDVDEIIGSGDTHEVSHHEDLKEIEETIDHPIAPARTPSYESPFLVDLKSYLYACINNSMIEQAHNTFFYYRYRNRRVTDVSLYNIMLKAWANVGRIGKVKELRRSMSTANITPNMQTFACHLLCLSRLKDNNTTKEEVSQVLGELRQHGFTLQRLFVDSLLLRNQRESVLKLLSDHNLQTDFEPDPVTVSCQIPLLSELDHSVKKFRVMDISQDKLKEWHLEQLTNEREGMVKVSSAYHDEQEVDSNQEDQSRLKALWDKKEIEWKNVLRKSIQRNLTMYRHQHADVQGINAYPFLTSVGVDELVRLLMNELMTLTVTADGYSPPTYVLYRSLGEKVHSVYLTNCKVNQAFSQDLSSIYSQYLSSLSSPRSVNARVLFEEMARKNNIQLSTELTDAMWSDRIIKTVGKFLYEILYSDLKIEQDIMKKKKGKSGHSRHVPLLFNYYKTVKSKIMEEVRLNPVFLSFAKAACGREISFDITAFPMLCPPMPWISSKIGGYHLFPSHLIRETQFAIKQDTKEILPILDSLNALQATPWKVNDNVLNVAIEVFSAKGDENLDIPLHSSKLPEIPAIPKNIPYSERSQLVRKAMKIRQKRNEMYSLWCTCLYKLSIANHLRGRVFWLPHNLDFRGRSYTIPPHLSHISDDLCRGLITFAEGSPLGEKGLDWLKIHVINLTGFKKRSSIPERLQYANEILDDILDSADNPLTGRRWWTTSDEPWQTLAACKELATALRSPDPTKFVSYFPVHQDGSCNGLQHYAALGRDVEGGKSVNVVPSSHPQDVYSEVAKLVEKRRQQHAQEGLAIAQLLDGFIERKVVKQPVMTFVYGVTKYGARAQIMKRLVEMEKFDQKKVFEASGYIAEQVFAAIQEMFTSSREIQNWLTECAIVISKELKQPVEWRTPLGLRVIQPYYKSRESSSVNSLKGKINEPNSRKQKNGFAPNFIHSLDATHMMLTALACESSALTFVSIHDCYWTHASNVDAMNDFCRKYFVALHSCPILSDLHDSILSNYSPELKALADRNPSNYRAMMSIISRVPKTGSLRLEDVLDSVFFFS